MDVLHDTFDIGLYKDYQFCNLVKNINKNKTNRLRQILYIAQCQRGRQAEANSSHCGSEM